MGFFMQMDLRWRQVEPVSPRDWQWHPSTSPFVCLFSLYPSFLSYNSGFFSHPTQFCVNSLDWHWRPFMLWSQPDFLTFSSYSALAHSSHSGQTGLRTKYTLLFLPESICACCSLFLKCSSLISNSQNPTAILDEGSLISFSISHPLALTHFALLRIAVLIHLYLSDIAPRVTYVLLLSSS